MLIGGRFAMVDDGNGCGAVVTRGREALRP